MSQFRLAQFHALKSCKWLVNTDLESRALNAQSSRTGLSPRLKHWTYRSLCGSLKDKQYLKYSLLNFKIELFVIN